MAEAEVDFQENDIAGEQVFDKQDGAALDGDRRGAGSLRRGPGIEVEEATRRQEVGSPGGSEGGAAADDEGRSGFGSAGSGSEFLFGTPRQTGHAAVEAARSAIVQARRSSSSAFIRTPAPEASSGQRARRKRQ